MVYEYQEIVWLARDFGKCMKNYTGINEIQELIMFGKEGCPGLMRMVPIG